MKQGSILKFQVNRANKGGIRGQLEGINGVEAFLPFSKMTASKGKSDSAKQRAQDMVGTMTHVKIVAVRHH